MTPHEQALGAASYELFMNIDGKCTEYLVVASAAIRAYLQARWEIDGAALCVVPNKCDFIDADKDDRAFENGWNACRTQTLASAEARDA